MVLFFSFMARGISSGDDDCAKRDHGGSGSNCGCGCMSELCIAKYSSPLPFSSAAAPPYETTSSGAVRRKPQIKGMGDVFYGNDDYEDMNDYMYKEDDLECMRRERDSKAFKRRRKGRCIFFECFEFLRLLCCIIRF